MLTSHSLASASKTYRSTLRPGFTLIELLVVISIIALLVGILLPALGAARHSAMLAKDMAQLAQIALGSEAYTLDNDGHYVVNYSSQSSANTVSIDEQLSPYVPGGGMSQDQAMTAGIVTPRAVFNFEVWQSPVDPEPPYFSDQKRSYAISRAPQRNAFTGEIPSWQYDYVAGLMRTVVSNSTTKVDPYPADPSVYPTPGYSLRTSQVTQPSSTIAFAPLFSETNICGRAQGDSVAPYELLNIDRAHFANASGMGSLSWDQSIHRLYGYDRAAKVGDNPRYTSPNFAFCDGHVERKAFEETLDPDMLEDDPDSYKVRLAGKPRMGDESLWNALK